MDARAAAVVMRVIKNVANTGRTVICTIHQVGFLFSLLFLAMACVRVLSLVTSLTLHLSHTRII